MYQVYEMMEGPDSMYLAGLVFQQSFWTEQEAVQFADKLRKSWVSHGQDRHFRVSYFGAKVYEN